MLATLAEPFDQEGWLYEIKWDGYRAIAFLHNGEAELISRNRQSYQKKYYPVYEAVKAWGIDAVVDGEIIVRKKSGKHDFNALQNWKNAADGELLYYVFDLLWLDGHDLTQMPLEQRRTLLQERIPPDNSVIRFSENFDTTATRLLEVVSDMGLEGIIAKKAGSAYYPGERTTDWLKMKSHQRQEVVVGGYILLAGSPKPFSSLLVGVYEKGQLRYTGKVGTGFSHAQQKEMLLQFEPLIRKTNPFDILPAIKPPHFRLYPRGQRVTFLEPRLVCEISFTEKTADGLMRHPAFSGMRTDKTARQVNEEHALPAKKIRPPRLTKNKTMVTPTVNTDLLLQEPEEMQVVNVDKKELKCTNLNKLYWREEKISKRDLINYYHQVAPFMLPYLKNRPMSLHRHPNGFAGKSFYQKDVTSKVPDWVETMAYRSEEEPNVAKEFMVCTNEAGLIYMANLGCIEINPWSSTIEHPDHPDWCVLDLDPDKKNTFDEVIEVALVAHSILEKAGIPSLCKTSGSTGLHIYIPLQKQYTYEQSLEFARLVSTMTQRELPKLTSTERALSKRKGKIYLDFFQNRPQATLAAPYSVRPKPRAPVSMPLEWSEVKKGLRITDFTISNAVDLLKTRGDLFQGVLGKGADLAAGLTKLEAQWENP